MKRVYFVRHAKSSWGHPQLSDHDRPLNNRGLRDAPNMADAVKGLEHQIEFVLSSTAARASETAKYFIEAMRLSEAQTEYQRSLYHAMPATMLESLYGLDDALDTVALFAHNPGMTMLINDVSEIYVDNVPTCGVFLVECPVSSWTEFDFSKSSLKLFLKPKEL